MISSSMIEMADLSRQKRFRTDLNHDLTPDHSVGQAVEHFLESLNIPENGLRWTAFSRGVLLDKKARLGDLPEEDVSWTVMPEVSAGA